MRSFRMFSTTTAPFLAACVAILAAGAAHAASFDDALATMARAEGDTYLAARADALSSTTLAEVRARRAALPVTDKTWREAAALATLEAHLTPDGLKALHQAEGLNPAVYLKARRAEPAVARELSRANLSAGALVEVALKEAAGFPFAADSAYPAGADVARLRTIEERALAAGAITALARSGDATAPFVLREVMLRPRFGDARKQAAVMLGVAASPDFANDAYDQLLSANDDESLRAAVAIGLGKVRATRSLERLDPLATDDPSRDVRVAATRALGALGSSWGHAATGTVGQKLRADVGEVLLGVLVGATTQPEQDAVVDALSMLASPSTVPALEQLIAGGDSRVGPLAQRALRRVKRSLKRRR